MQLYPLLKKEKIHLSNFSFWSFFLEMLIPLDWRVFYYCIFSSCWGLATRSWGKKSVHYVLSHHHRVLHVPSAQTFYCCVIMVWLAGCCVSPGWWWLLQWQKYCLWSCNWAQLLPLCLCFPSHSSSVCAFGHVVPHFFLFKMDLSDTIFSSSSFPLLHDFSLLQNLLVLQHHLLSSCWWGWQFCFHEELMLIMAENLISLEFVISF